METVEPERSSASKDILREHILKAKEFSGTAVQYCRENNLDVSAFYHCRRRFGLASKVSRRKKFIRVMAEPRESKRLERSLPDPKWLAEFTLRVLKSR